MLKYYLITCNIKTHFNNLLKNPFLINKILFILRLSIILSSINLIQTRLIM